MKVFTVKTLTCLTFSAHKPFSSIVFTSLESSEHARLRSYQSHPVIIQSKVMSLAPFPLLCAFLLLSAFPHL